MSEQEVEHPLLGTNSDTLQQKASSYPATPPEPQLVPVENTITVPVEVPATAAAPELVVTGFTSHQTSVPPGQPSKPSTSELQSHEASSGPGVQLQLSEDRATR